MWSTRTSINLYLLYVILCFFYKDLKKSSGIMVCLKMLKASSGSIKQFLYMIICSNLT